MKPLSQVVRQGAAFIGWGSLIATVCVTLVPIAGRPHIPNIGPDLERLTAFIVLGGAFSIAYPTRRLQILVAIIAVAITLEVTQILAPSRHGRPHDALVKVAGGLMGIVIAAICDRNKPNG
jgi:glycopeptide antibiotics resistance protein